MTFMFHRPAMKDPATVIPFPNSKPTFQIALPMRHLALGSNVTVTAMLVCGEHYTVHPLRAANGGADIPLGALPGLTRSRVPGYEWQLAPFRRFLFKASAERMFITWANETFSNN